MGIALEGTIVLYVELTKCTPAHQVLGELEGAVLHHLSIESAVGSVVDILEEDTVHRRLYGSAQFLCVDVKDMCLGCSRQAGSKQKCC